MKLIDVYSELHSAKLNCWRLLQEREETVNISHKVMPTWEEHCRFIDSKPYKAWYLIQDASQEFVGTIYVSKMDEIGLFIYKAHQGQGKGRSALKALRELYKGRLLANIAPSNYRSKAMFISSGFKPIQETYELSDGEPVR